MSLERTTAKLSDDDDSWQICFRSNYIAVRPIMTPVVNRGDSGMRKSVSWGNVGCDMSAGGCPDLVRHEFCVVSVTASTLPSWPRQRCC
jgi:hypothetical protein